MQIFIKTLAGKTITLDVNPNDTVERLKQRIEETEGIKFKDQSLMLAGK
jgi:large subunit ribosomal protein L40e